MNRSKRGFIRKLVLSKIIAKKGFSERVFRVLRYLKISRDLIAHSGVLYAPEVEHHL